MRKECYNNNMEKKIKKINNSSEDEAQSFICSWCWQNNLVPVAVPNGVNLSGAIGIFKANGLSTKALSAINAKQMKLLIKEGLHTGFPDMMVFGQSRDGLNILFMENKVKNNKPSEIQIACHWWLRSLGFVVEVSSNSIDAIIRIKNFFHGETQEDNIRYLITRKEILNKNAG